MQSSHSNYLKLAFTSAQLLKHIQFQKVKRKQAFLQFYIHAQFIEDGTKNIISLPPVKLSEIMTSDGSIFYPKSDRWDCFLFQQKAEGITGSLKLKFQICENQKNIHKSVFQSKALLSFFLQPEEPKSRLSSQQSKELIQGELDNGASEKSQKISVVDLPFESPQIIIPLQKFLREPYKIHQISLDFYIPPQNKIIYRVSSTMTLEAEKKAQTARKQSKERDGVLNFQLVFLPKTRPELRLHNIRLKTKSFAKCYKLFVCQVLREQSQEKSIKRLSQDETNYASTIYMKSVLQQILKQKNVVSKLEVLLQVSEWQSYQNQQSFVFPLILPMTIRNNLDQIQFLLQYESTDANKQQSKKLQTQSVTLSKVIAVDYFYKKKQNPSKLTKQQIIFRNKEQTFQLQFEFEILLEKGLESTTSNLRSTETEFQQFGEQGYVGLQSKVQNVPN